MNKKKARAGRLTTIILLTAALVVGAPMGAWAWWSATVTQSAKVTAATLTTPTHLSCTTAGVLITTANLKWDAEPKDPAATYRVTFVIRNASGVVTDTQVYNTASTTVVVDGGLLGSLLNNVLALLGLGATVTATVQSVHGTWTSPPTAGIKLTGGSLIGVLCGSATPTP
jgi:predicted ribosomally synthesized peptide with SipW-like signal peptide